VDHAPVLCYGVGMPRSIIRLNDLVIDTNTITAAHLTGSRRGVVVHHNGCTTILDAEDEEQAREWLSRVANAMQGPAPEECGR